MIEPITMTEVWDWFGVGVSAETTAYVGSFVLRIKADVFKAFMKAVENVSV